MQARVKSEALVLVLVFDSKLGRESSRLKLNDVIEAKIVIEFVLLREVVARVRLEAKSDGILRRRG